MLHCYGQSIERKARIAGSIEEEVREILKKILNKHNEKILLKRGLAYCTHCKKLICRGDKYCQYCGKPKEIKSF